MILAAQESEPKIITLDVDVPTCFKYDFENLLTVIYELVMIAKLGDVKFKIQLASGEQEIYLLKMYVEVLEQGMELERTVDGTVNVANMVYKRISTSK